MFAIDPALAVVREWIKKVEDDLKTAQIVLRADKGLTGKIAFHAQQSVEKYLKAYLAFRKEDFRRIYDIEELISLLPERDRPRLGIEEQARLTEYAVAPRYPGWGGVFPESASDLY